MQNPLMFLKSLFATWPSSSSTSWVIGTILPFLCGLGLFLLRLPSLQRNPSSRPPCERRNIRKRQVEPRGKSSRSRKKRGALKAPRAAGKGLAEVRGQVSLSHSSPGRLSSKGCSHRSSCQGYPGEASNTAYARAQQPRGKPVAGATLTMTPAHSLGPLTHTPIPLASTLPAEPPADLTRIPPDTTAMSTAPAHSSWPFPNSGHGRMSWRIEFLSQWHMIKVLFFPGSAHLQSQQGHLSCHRPVASFRGGPTHREGETESPSLANPDAPKLLKMEIRKRTQTKAWPEKEEQDAPGSPQMLEAPSITSGLNVRWRPPFPSLESAELNASEAQPLALPRSTFPSSATRDSGTRLKADSAEFSGKPLEPHPGEKHKTLTTKASVPRLAPPLPSTSPVSEENQKAPGGTLPGNGCGPSEASLMGQQGRPPSPSFAFSLSDRNGQSGTVVGAEQGRLHLSPGSAMARNEPLKESGGGASPEPCRGVATLEGESGSQSWSQVGGTGDALGTKPLQALPEKEEVFHVSPLRKMLRRLLPCLRPNKEEAPEEPLAKASPRQPPPRARHGSHAARRRMAGLFRRHPQYHPLSGRWETD
ncbi:spermatogenesis-associated protein 31E1-like [Equus caballus]|uniref:spermatogenesis-associated protein 31E1-like n=1 Tax=Equus caballus TaxID=9796 RepID=UPI0038B2CBE3